MGAARIGIIGAGVAGGTAARALTGAGVSCEVFEKARGPGGRTARRREGDVGFDHGAAYFTVRDLSFGAFVDECVDAGSVARWEGRIVRIDGTGALVREEKGDRFVGVPGMNELARRMLGRSNVEYGLRVERLEGGPGELTLVAEDGSRRGPFDAVIVTAPPAQSATLVRRELAARIGSVSMRPTWSVMLTLGEPVDVGFDGAFVEDSCLSWIACNSSKPGRAGSRQTWVIHASHAWSEANLERAFEDVADDLARAFGRLVGGRAEILSKRAHRWRYASPASPLGESCVADAEGGVVVGGDWCVGGRVEGAFMSGSAAAEAALAMVGSRDGCA